MGPRWSALSWRLSETEGGSDITETRLWESGLITTQLALPGGAKAKNEEMKVYEASNRDCVDVSTEMLPGDDKMLSVARYINK